MEANDVLQVGLDWVNNVVVPWFTDVFLPWIFADTPQMMAAATFVAVVLFFMIVRPKGDAGLAAHAVAGDAPAAEAEEETGGRRRKKRRRR